MNGLTDLQIGNRHFVAGEYQQAVAAFHRYAEAHPEDRAKAYVRIAECYLRANALVEPVRVAPGVTLVSQGDRPSASHYFRLAIEADPGHAGAHRGLARLLPERSLERRAHLERAVELQPDYQAFIDLGDLYRSADRDYERAYQMYRRAQERLPRDATAYRRLSDICRRRGRPEEAIEWANQWRAVNAQRKPTS